MRPEFITEPLPVLIDQRIDRSGGPDACWPYMGPRHEFGYGTAYIAGRNFGVHRIMMMRSLGRILSTDELVCHHCDNPPCCNPAHLFVGSQGDNMRDATAKGRRATGTRNGAYTHPERKPRGETHGLVMNPSAAARGTDNGIAKLNERIVLEIRARSEAGERRTAIAKDYGVSRTLVYLVATRQIWRHVR